MRKSKRLRALSGVASAALLASYLLPYADLPTTLTAKADGVTAVYGKEYTIENILTDFGLFSRTDITGQNHIVGSFAAGGEFKTNTSFGDGALHASYAHTIYEFSNYNLASYITDPELNAQAKASGKLYYNEDKTGFAENDWHRDHLQEITNDYIDFDAAFEKIQEWSDAQKNTPNA